MACGRAALLVPAALCQLPADSRVGSARPGLGMPAGGRYVQSLRSFDHPGPRDSFYRPARARLVLCGRAGSMVMGLRQEACGPPIVSGPLSVVAAQRSRVFLKRSNELPTWLAPPPQAWDRLDRSPTRPCSEGELLQAICQIARPVPEKREKYFPIIS